MPKKLQKSLQDYLSNIRKPTQKLHHLPSKTSWILRGCKHPRTPSLAINVKENAARETNGAATLSDIDRFLFENFSSLYQDDDDDDEKGMKCDKCNNRNEENNGVVLLESPKFLDLAENCHGSQRFFIQPSSSGSIIGEARTGTSTTSEDKDNNNRNQNNGVVLFEQPRFLGLPENFPDSNWFLIQRRLSGSVIEDARTSMSTTSGDMAYSSSASTATSENDSTRTKKTTDDDDDDDDKDQMAADDFIALLTHSTDPYDDFKRSMHEMLEARLHFHGKVDWEFMEELLFCYLNLNDKKSYKFILNAFVDLVLILRKNSGEVPAKSWRNVRSGGDERRKTREI